MKSRDESRKIKIIRMNENIHNAPLELQKETDPIVITASLLETIFEELVYLREKVDSILRN